MVQTLVKGMFALSLMLATGVYSGGGCEIEGPPGFPPIKIRPCPPPNPAEGVVIGQVTIDGRLFYLVDVNGDGVADFLNDPETGEWYKILPPESPKPTTPQAVPPSTEVTGPLLTEAAVGSSVTCSPGGSMATWDRVDLDGSFLYLVDMDDDGVYDRVYDPILDEWYDITPPDPEQVPDGADWEMTAEEYLALCGLDVIPDGSIYYISGGLINDFDTLTWDTDVTLPWTTGFFLPASQEYDLTWELSLLGSTACEFPVIYNEDHPAFMFVHLSGSAVEIAKYSMHMGMLEWGLTDTEGDSWCIVIDPVAKTATLTREGEQVACVSLE